MKADDDMALLALAMNLKSEPGATYTLPPEVMTEYARLLRADERKKCAARIEEVVSDYDRDYRELGAELAYELIKNDRA